MSAAPPTASMIPHVRDQPDSPAHSHTLGPRSCLRPNSCPFSYRGTILPDGVRFAQPLSSCHACAVDGRTGG